MRGCRYQYRARHSSRLQPCRNIRGLAEYVGVLVRARTDNYRTGINAHASRQLWTC